MPHCFLLLQSHVNGAFVCVYNPLFLFVNVQNLLQCSETSAMSDLSVFVLNHSVPELAPHELLKSTLFPLSSMLYVKLSVFISPFPYAFLYLESGFLFNELSEMPSALPSDWIAPPGKTTTELERGVRGSAIRW